MVSVDMRRICVYCGSNQGASGAYAAAAIRLGELLASEGIGLVYGGASVGLMGMVADAVLRGGGEVVGVIPTFFRDRLAHRGLSELVVVDSMAERKRRMFDLSDGFIALPGGIGTFEEFFETLCKAQLGHHAKPCGLLNTAGYYDKLLDFLDHSVSERFVLPAHRGMVLVDSDQVGLLRQFRDYRPPVVEKWLD